MELYVTFPFFEDQTHFQAPYYQVQGILIGVVAAFVVFITIIGPEHHGSHFEQSKTAFEQGGGEVDPETLVQDNDSPRIGSPLVDEKERITEKEQLETNQNSP
jgi:MFS transporter, SHS family, lactate transporter